MHGGVHSGKCYCSAVTYRARGLADIWYCHCRQCRSLTGHHLAACRTQTENIEIAGDVAWTSVSPRAAYGFCAKCHSPLFWRNREATTLSVLAGSLDNTDGIATIGHIFVAEKGSYYTIDDGLPQFPLWPDTAITGAPDEPQ